MWLAIALGLACAHAPPEVWLPAGTVSVLKADPADHPLVLGLGFLDQPCVGDVVAALDTSYLVQPAPGARMTAVAFGRARRRDVEACGRELAQTFGEGRRKGGATVQRDGRLTTFGTTGSAKVQIAAFWRGGLVVGDTIGEVDAVIRGPRLRRLDPIRTLLPRLEGDGARSVTTLDYAGAVTGVPSRGMVLVVAGERPNVTTTARLLFASPDEAAACVATVHAIADDPNAEPAARELASIAAPIADGDEVEVDVGRVLAALMARKDLSEWVTRAAERVKAQETP